MSLISVKYYADHECMFSSQVLSISSIFCFCYVHWTWLLAQDALNTVYHKQSVEDKCFLRLICKKKQNIIGYILKILYLLNKYQDLPSCYQHEKTTMSQKKYIRKKRLQTLDNRSNNISNITSKHGDIGFNDTIWDWWYSMMCSRSIYQTRCRYLNKLYIWMLLAAILGSKEQRTRHSTQLFVGHNWIAKCFVAKSSSFVVFPQKDQKDGWSITKYIRKSAEKFISFE